MGTFSCECATDDDCAGNQDTQQCVEGVCVVCDLADNAGCFDPTPLCDGADYIGGTDPM